MRSDYLKQILTEYLSARKVFLTRVSEGNETRIKTEVHLSLLLIS
jgi:hypothetical protein